MNSLRQTVIAIGENRGTPRVYLQGAWLAKAGFTPRSRFRASFETDRVVLELDSSGDRTVSGKKDDTVPVVDVECRALGTSLTAKRLQVTSFTNRIEITPAYTVVLISQRRLTYTEGSLFSGGGFLSEAARQLGFTPRFGVEVDPDYAAIYERNHPGAQMFNTSIEDVAWDAMRVYRPLGLLTMGIPCEPFSNIRRLDRGGQTKRDKEEVPEAHELGDMVFWAARAVEATNPHTVIIENVPGFLKAGASHILMAVLRRLGYQVDARVIDPLDYGELTGRKRAVVIAHSAPIRWPEPISAERRLGEILEPGEHDWFDRASKNWLFDHWDKQTAKGNGFAGQQVTANSRSVGTIKKRYFAQQGDNPVVAHPTEAGVFRWFTLNEVKRLHCIPDTYYVGEAKTRAGEVIGQGVHVGLFKQIIDSVTGPDTSRCAHENGRIAQLTQ